MSVWAGNVDSTIKVLVSANEFKIAFAQSGRGVFGKRLPVDN